MLSPAEMLIEPTAVADIYVSGLSHIEDLGDGNFRLVFFAYQESPYGGSERVVKCRLIATSPAMFGCAKQVLTAIGARCCRAGDWRHGVH